MFFFFKKDILIRKDDELLVKKSDYELYCLKYSTNYSICNTNVRRSIVFRQLWKINIPIGSFL